MEEMQKDSGIGLAVFSETWALESIQDIQKMRTGKSLVTFIFFFFMSSYFFSCKYWLFVSSRKNFTYSFSNTVCYDNA